MTCALATKRKKTSPKSGSILSSGSAAKDLPTLPPTLPRAPSSPAATAFMTWNASATASSLGSNAFSPYKNGIPSHDTFARVLAMLDSNLFASWFQHWADTARDHPGHVAVDGCAGQCSDRSIKRLRWSPWQPSSRSAVGAKTPPLTATQASIHRTFPPTVSNPCVD